GALKEAERPSSTDPVLFEDVCPRDVTWHQVGCELDAVERQVQDVSEGADEQRLGQPRNADEQAVTAGEERSQEVLDDVPLADDPFLNLPDDLRLGRGELLHRGEVLGAGRGERALIWRRHGAVL